MKLIQVRPEAGNIGRIVSIAKEHPKYGGQMGKIVNIIGVDKAQVAVLSSKGGLLMASAMIKLEYLYMME